MRKLMTWIAVLAILAVAAASAEEEFTIRDGIHWKMSMEEVEAIEGERDDYGVYEIGRGVMKLWYDLERGKTVSLFPCALSFNFIDDKLYLLRYESDYSAYGLDEVQEYLYLTNAMTSLYGEGHAPSEEETLRVAIALNPAYEEDSYLQEAVLTRLVMWNLPHGTTAVLGFDYGRLFLTYFSYDTLLTLIPEDGVYNTDGL